MAYNHNQYTSGYEKENYDRVVFKIPKGKKAILQALAKENNITDHKGQISVSRMIVSAIEEKYGIDLSKAE